MNNLPETVKEFLASLPVDMEGPERSLKFRLLVNESKRSESALRLACSIYRAVGEGLVSVTSVHDVNMYVTAVTENLDIIPLVKEDIERLLNRFCSNSGRAWRLWAYVLEVYATRQCA